MAEGCPLGYDCDNPTECVRFSIGVIESKVADGVEAGLDIHVATLGGLTGPMMSLCDGPLEQGLNDRARAAEAAVPDLVDKGIGIVEQAASARATVELRRLNKG